MTSTSSSLLVLFALLACSHPLPAAAQTLTIIAHPNVPVHAISRERLSDIFMKRTRTWPDGSVIRPVNMVESSPLRRIFLSTVLHHTEREMARYWIGQKLFTGEYPPVKLESETAVIRFVSTVEGAVGYVTDASPERLRSVKILTVTK